MDIVILKTNTDSKNNKKIFDAMEKLGHNLVGFVALGQLNDIQKIDDYNFYPAEYIHRLKYDLALIDEVVNVPLLMQALKHYKVPMHKTRTYMWLLQQIMTLKYENVADPVIQQTLAYWQTHEMTVFNQHWEGVAETFDEVHIDETCNLPYINFKTIEGKERKMYYPRNGYMQIQMPDGKKYIHNVLREQVPTSPHLYVKGTHKVDEGDVLIDAGVCEGNFALRYADICSKIYLFEPDKKWFEPLYYSFKDCWDKVEFIPRFVSESTWGGVERLPLMTLLKFPSAVKSSSKWMLKALNLRHCAVRKKF